MLSKTNSDLQAVDEDEFTAEELSAMDAIIQRNRSKPGWLIPVLEDVHEALETVRYLRVMQELCDVSTLNGKKLEKIKGSNPSGFSVLIKVMEFQRKYWRVLQ